MSSSINTFPSATTTTVSPSASASPSATDSGGGGSSPPSSTLYLLTFLATLFVLLFVSCGIVLRSFIMRRRFRQQIEEQIAAGLLPPEALHFKKDYGEKPQLWDVSIVPAQHREPSWELLSPLTARVLHDSGEPSSDDSDNGAPPSPRYQRFARILRRRPSSPAAPPVPDMPDAPTLFDGADVQVAVMVAMPSQRHDSTSIPEMAIGLSKVPVL